MIALSIAVTSFAAAAQPATARSAFEGYYSIRTSPIWFSGGKPTAAANSLPAILRRSELDGVSGARELAGQVELALRSANRKAGNIMQLDRVLSSAWVRFVSAVQSRIPGADYGDERMRRIESTAEILTHAAEPEPDQLQHVLRVAAVNPFYARIRDALWNEMQSSGYSPTPAAIANLQRLRFLAPSGKFLVVDARSAMLYMYEGGEQVDSMRVITGKPRTPTPIVVSFIYFVTINPYWNVPANLVQSLIAPRVLANGTSYLRMHHYEVVTKYSPDATELPPESVDWKAVANGAAEAMVRQLPGAFNSMGTLKFGFPNASEIYLHDSPEKALFGRQDRELSNGCIRVEDAQRLGRWLLGGRALASSASPEQYQTLPEAVPIYVTYTTIGIENGKAAFIADPYGLDPPNETSMTSGNPSQTLTRIAEMSRAKSK